ncbi:MAG: energy-coupling factor transporter transmembrane protein EcfT [Anaeromicrobium sp.]|jgi:energy-coupling factor transport system permease protein|uniref:energy-coupling factor transporter transmembrane component T family protein n=1 Tax=Anaeromicrobium sp. TaxID=1929132 RepID=UPI0025D4D3B7|nr:energy-coupling factor transporter transmembrane component T [Anaeromicrobium sp.]MCT4594524.1 energy-coupling factor transporter transmembrane protein EcfT [Anaeromicrobium sp.]
MLRDITIGQYYPIDSSVHKMDPRVKIIITFAYIMSLFLVKNFMAYGYVIGFLVITIGLSKVPVKFIVRGLKPLFLIITFTFLINMFMTKGEILYEVGPLNITKEGLRQAVFMATRLILLIIGTSMLTLSTSPIELTDGIEKLLNPFKKIGVPAHELAMMMTIALRFIPTLLEETDKIMKAQMARGADFESGNLMKRAKSLVPLLVPLFISAFRRAEELAMAMEARCYRGGENRTRMNQLSISSKDYVGAFVTILMIGAVIIDRVMY